MKLKKLLLIAAAICLIAPSAFAVTCIYDWEDCGTILGMYPTDGVIATSVTDPVYEGFRALKVEDNAASGTPQAYVAWVTDCANGDVIEASFWRYDLTPGASPSCRIWAHYTLGADVTDYKGSAGGNDDYGPGTGWDLVSWSWTFETPDDYWGDRDGLVIECRTYSNPGDIVYVDYITVSVNPNHGQCIHFPTAGPSATENACWGSIKALYQ